MNGEQDRFDEVPAAIAKSLRASAAKTAVLVPGAVDEAVLSQARERFAEIRRRRIRFRRAAWLAAAACAVALAIISISIINTTRYERADIDHNGQVDILDAFTLARRIQQGSAGGVDINNDGLINKSDVDAIAAQAVKLKKGRV